MMDLLRNLEWENARSCQTLIAFKKAYHDWRLCPPSIRPHDLKHGLLCFSQRLSVLRNDLQVKGLNNKSLIRYAATDLLLETQSEGEGVSYRDDAIKASEEAQLSKMEEARKALAESLSQSRPKSAAQKRREQGMAATSSSAKATERPASALPWCQWAVIYYSLLFKLVATAKRAWRKCSRA